MSDSDLKNVKSSPCTPKSSKKSSAKPCAEKAAANPAAAPVCASCETVEPASMNPAAAPGVKDKPVRALVLGGNGGLLGQALVKVLQAHGWEVHATSRKDFDHLDSDRLENAIYQAAPQVVFNTIAYTQVDNAEEEPEKALEVNRSLPASLGRLSVSSGFKLIHYSTDFVFNGQKTKPYLTTDPTDPQCVYGRSKLEGEQALAALALENCCIVRTAWLFGPGRKNFITTILRLCEERKEVKVVFDQIGSPTYTVDLAHYSLKLAEKALSGEASGIYHLVNSGQASWCELASEAVRLAQCECRVLPILSADFPQKAVRPAYSVLDPSRFTELTGITPRPWLKALGDYLYSDFKVACTCTKDDIY